MSGWGVTLLGFANVMDVLESLRVQFEGNTTYLVGPTVSYAIYQEKGTSKIEARPFVKPAAEQVQANLSSEVQRIASAQGIALDSEAAVVRCAALAVQDRMKTIARRKEIRDTGDLIGSISIQQV